MEAFKNLRIENGQVQAIPTCGIGACDDRATWWFHTRWVCGKHLLELDRKMKVKQAVEVEALINGI